MLRGPLPSHLVFPLFHFSIFSGDDRMARMRRPFDAIVSARYTTQRELSDAVGLSDSAVSAILSGRRRVGTRGNRGRESEAARLARALGLTEARVVAMSDRAVRQRNEG